MNKIQAERKAKWESKKGTEVRRWMAFDVGTQQAAPMSKSAGLEKNTADCWFLRSHVGPEWRMVEDLQVASDYADHNRKVQEPKLQRRQFGF